MPEVPAEPSRRELSDADRRYLAAMEGKTVPLAHYSMALDEIYALRATAAETVALLDLTLKAKSLGLRVRNQITACRDVLRLAAHGHAERRHQQAGDVGLLRGKRALKYVDAPSTLTRSRWEQQRGLDG